MKYSDTTKDLFAALAEFQSELTPPPKNRTVKVETRTGGSYTFAYAELGTIWTHIAPLWKKSGFCWISSVTRDEKTNHPKLTTRIAHKSGEWMESEFPLPNINDTKAFAGEITYARRYSFSMMMGLASQEDADEMPDRPRGRQPQERPPAQPRQPQPNKGAGTAPQGDARIKPATSPGSGGGDAKAPAPASQPVRPKNPGQKEREEIVELATANDWPVERIPEYLKLAFHVPRLDMLSWEQFAELKKVIEGDLLFAEVMEMMTPKPGEFGYVGPAPTTETPEPGAQG